MGVFKFQPKDVRRKNQIYRFDGSPDFAIAKEYGFVEGSVELQNSRYDKGCTVYDVFALTSTEASKTASVGTLFYKAPLWPGGPSVHF